jgi:hypothetical protein
MPTTYIPILNVRFNEGGGIIFKTGSSVIPAQSSSDNSAWSSGKTIYELQRKAFADLNDTLVTKKTACQPYFDTNRECPEDAPNLPASMHVFYKALDSIIILNAFENSTEDKYNIVFYNPSNGSIDYTAYDNLVKTRHMIRAQMNYINNVQGTLSHEQSLNYANGIYMNTLFAILATSLLYLVFIHLR